MDWLIVDNPWEVHHANPIPARAAQDLMQPDYVTLILPDHAAGKVLPPQGPLFQGEPKPDDFPLGGFKDVRETLRALVDFNPGLIKAAIGKGSDGIVLQVHEPTFNPHTGTVEPTGQIFKVPVPEDLPVDPVRGGDVYFLKPGQVTWPAHLEEGLSIAGEHLSPADASVPAGQARPRLWAEILTQVTGRPARITQFSSGEDAAAAWKQKHC